MALTAEEKQLCAEWLTEPARKWQVLNRSQWKYQFREKTLVRFVEEATMDESIVPLLLEYLTSDDCKSTIQLYGQAVSSEWAPTRAWYEISNKAVGNLKAVRLYHALSIEPENGEDGPYLIEDGCAYRVSWTNYWKRESVQQVPQSTSGVSYRIVNLQRDPDTGLFSYSIEKRERVQQDIEEYLTRSTAFEDVSEEVHMGVRGDPSLGGKPASVANGKTVTRKVTKNADCTHDVHNTTTQDKAVPGAVVTTEVGVRGTTVTTENRNMPTPASAENLAPGESVRNQQTDSKLWNQTIRRFIRNVLVWLRGTCRKTIFDHSHSETTNVKENPGFSHVEEAGNGVIHELTVQKTAEGYDITESTTEEKPVSEASESVHVELDGTVRTVVHRNQPNKAPAPTAVGSSVTNERTNGGRWNQTIRNFVKVTLLKIGAACSKTIFSHRHSSTTLQGSDPGFTHVEEAGGGVIRRKTVTQTEKGFRVEESETEEKPVSEASERVEVGLEGTVRVVTNRHQQGKAPAPTAVGESVENTKTPGGLWNHTIRKRVLKSLVKLGEDCRKTFFSHSHSKSIVQGSDPGFDHVAEAANGIIRDKRVSRTSTGAYRVDESETTEKPVSKSNERIEKTLDGTVRTVTNRNQSSPAPEPTDIGESVENSRTEGGLWNQVIRKLIPNSMLKIAESCSKTLYAHRHSKSTVQSNDPGFSHVEEAGGGRIASKNVSRTHNGSYRIEEGETVEKPVPKAERTARMTLNGLTVRVVNRNQSAPLPDPTEVGKSVSNRRTDGGLYDTVETTEGEKPAGKTGESCSRDKFTHRHSVTKNEKELQNPETVFATGQIVHKSGHLTGNGTANNTTETTTAVSQIQRYHWEDERGRHYVVKYRNQPSEINEAPSDADSVSLNDSVNAFGLHDGQYTYSYLAGRWKFSAKDYKFIKHGARQEYYDVKRRRRTRVWSHRKWIIEPRRIRGDAFWDYLNELARANPERTTPGTLGVKLIERYSDSDGNLLAEWVQVDLVQAEAWQVCDNDCKHAFVAQQMSNDHRFIINSLLASLS